MRTIGFEFLNSDEALSQKIKKFTSIEDIISARTMNAKKNRSNNSTYITKSSSTSIEIYGKTYGANKYETSLICYAMSYLCLSDYSIKLYEIVDNGLSELPKTCLYVIEKMGKVEDIPINMTLERKSFDENISLRSPVFIYNLLDKLGPKKCALCECEITELIQGAHIWPVSDIKRKHILATEEKFKHATDGENGIWLCENHHKMFDRNLLKICTNGKIIYKKELDPKHIKFMRDATTIIKLPSNIMTDKFVSYLERRYEIV
jgi:hypothetical protein